MYSALINRTIHTISSTNLHHNLQSLNCISNEQKNGQMCNKKKIIDRLYKESNIKVNPQDEHQHNYENTRNLTGINTIKYIHIDGNQIKYLKNTQTKYIRNESTLKKIYDNSDNSNVVSDFLARKLTSSILTQQLQISREHKSMQKQQQFEKYSNCERTRAVSTSQAFKKRKINNQFQNNKLYKTFDQFDEKFNVKYQKVNCNKGRKMNRSLLGEIYDIKNNNMKNLVGHSTVHNNNSNSMINLNINQDINFSNNNNQEYEPNDESSRLLITHFENNKSFENTNKNNRELKNNINSFNNITQLSKKDSFNSITQDINSNNDFNLNRNEKIKNNQNNISKGTINTKCYASSKIKTQAVFTKQRHQHSNQIIQSFINQNMSNSCQNTQTNTKSTHPNMSQLNIKTTNNSQEKLKTVKRQIHQIDNSKHNIDQNINHNYNKKNMSHNYVNLPNYVMNFNNYIKNKYKEDNLVNIEEKNTQQNKKNYSINHQKLIIKYQQNK